MELDIIFFTRLCRSDARALGGYNEGKIFVYLPAFLDESTYVKDISNTIFHEVIHYVIQLSNDHPEWDRNNIIDDDITEHIDRRNKIFLSEDIIIAKIEGKKLTQKQIKVIKSIYNKCKKTLLKRIEKDYADIMEVVS